MENSFLFFKLTHALRTLNKLLFTKYFLEAKQVKTRTRGQMYKEKKSPGYFFELVFQDWQMRSLWKQYRGKIRILTFGTSPKSSENKTHSLSKLTSKVFRFLSRWWPFMQIEVCKFPSDVTYLSAQLKIPTAGEHISQHAQ